MHTDYPTLTRRCSVGPHEHCAARRGSTTRRAWLANLGLIFCLLGPQVLNAQLLGTAASFAVLGGTPGVTSTGATNVFGSIGVFPAASITGFPPGLIVPGTGVFHAADAVAQQAQADTTAAYLTLAGLSGTSILPALGGQTLTPGVYNAGPANLTGTLTLNGPGLYVIQVSSLTTASGPGASSINLIGGATPCDVWWQVESSASIGTFSAVVGNMIALTSITLDTGATLQGRALARNGTVTLAGNTVTACFGGTAPGFVVPGGFPLTGPAVGVTALSNWAFLALSGLLGVAAFQRLRRTRDI
jgi:Ice-binding-like